MPDPQLIFSGVVAFSTLVYAALTWRLVAETKRMREVQTEPKVSVHAELNDEHGHGGIDLVVRNEGQGPARNVRFEFHGDATYFDKDRPLDQLPVIKNGLPYLGPNQTFRFLMGWLFGERFTRANEAPWTFVVRYENQSGKCRQETYVVDFSQFAQLIVGGGAPIYQISKHLEALQKDVHRLTTRFDKIRVITQTKQEEQKEMEQFLGEGREFTGKSDGKDAS